MKHTAFPIKRLGVLAAATVAVFALLAALPAVTHAAAYDEMMTGSAKSEQFASPQGCSCHSTLQGQWTKSMHAKALKDPFFTMQTKQVEADAGADVAKFCNTCHAPGAIMSGGVATAKDNDALDGITCTVCHQVVKQTAKNPGNASLAYTKGGPDGILHAQLMDPQAPHQASGNALFGKSEFCGACHNVTHPANGLKLETTYDEWKESSYAAQGVECQNCHMGTTGSSNAPYKGVAALGGPERKNIFAMTFIGANVGQGDAKTATQLLKRAAKISIESSATDGIIAAGKTDKVTVNVTNIGAGHSLPTGLTEVRNMWLEIKAVDTKTGKATEVGKTVFGTHLNDAKGSPVGAKFWLGASKESDLRIKAGETFSQTVDVVMPQDAKSGEGIKLVAELKYQSARDEDIKDAGVKNPTTIMASAQKVFTPTKAAAQESTAPTTQGDNGVLAGVIFSAIVLVIAIVVVIIVNRKKQRR